MDREPTHRLFYRIKLWFKILKVRKSSRNLIKGNGEACSIRVNNILNNCINHQPYCQKLQDGCVINVLCFRLCDGNSIALVNIFYKVSIIVTKIIHRLQLTHAFQHTNLTDEALAGPLLSCYEPRQ